MFRISIDFAMLLAMLLWSHLDKFCISGWWIPCGLVHHNWVHLSNVGRCLCLRKLPSCLPYKYLQDGQIVSRLLTAGMLFIDVWPCDGIIRLQEISSSHRDAHRPSSSEDVSINKPTTHIQTAGLQWLDLNKAVSCLANSRNTVKVFLVYFVAYAGYCHSDQDLGYCVIHCPCLESPCTFYKA